MINLVFWVFTASVYENAYVRPFVNRFINLTKILIIETFLILLFKFLFFNYFKKIYPLYCYFFIVQNYSFVYPYLIKIFDKYVIVNLIVVIYGFKLVLKLINIDTKYINYTIIIMLPIVLIYILKFIIKKYIILKNLIIIIFNNLDNKIKISITIYVITYIITFWLLL